MNGCETALDSITHCGACGRVCPANGGTPTCNAGVCGVSCSLQGTFAIKMQIPVTWPETDALRSGSGTFTYWFKLQASDGGGAVTTTLNQCGRRVPPLRVKLVNETFLFEYPDRLFDQTPPFMPSSTAALALGGRAPGSTLGLPLSAVLLGTTMSDPVNGTWPGRASSLTRVDHDGDGKPGVTAHYSNAGQYSQPRAGTSLFDDRVSDPYVAARVVLSLSGRLDSCTRSTGSATVRSIDTRIFGCRIAGRSRDCSSGEADFLDRNTPDYRTSSGSYSMLKVSDGATCADVERALP